jgi:hypothetical protein
MPLRKDRFRMDSFKLSPVVPSLLFLILLICSDTVRSLCCFDRIFSFGDSNADAGNSCLRTSNCGANKLPYGETYFHKPTGRNTDGRIIVDFFGIHYTEILDFMTAYTSLSTSLKPKHAITTFIQVFDL